MRTADEAVLWLANQQMEQTTGWSGQCLHLARTSWGLPGGIYDADAWWDQTPDKHKHPWSSRPPRGAPVYWRTGQHGHVAVTDGAGRVYTNDLPVPDLVGHVTLDYITNRWNAEPVGWASWLNGSELPLEPINPNPAPIIIKGKTKGTAMLVHKTTGQDSWWILSGAKAINVAAADARSWTGDRLTINDAKTWERFAATYC